MTTQLCRIEKEGIIRIPLKVLESVGLKTGEELEIRTRGEGLVLTKKRSIIANLRGRLKLDQQTAKEILESPEIEHEAF
jgi:bifunctional DNA-binding transcriptional regulator/antitoxin component of YhaV-PrlF toxin-antitoxin module